ncbi:aldose 1-epimerase family protein [Ciceribacter sp. RN22]|uniref:aldose 1-epimerase family protein n=1 Tax=Ciceribacter sp. RN22 TaxID=2954932 RepID=UPI002092D6AF|nr:aldose 1-epimerase family protein [Ciceribacter sp. RN22]MCO6178783.1 aldose 1-epimerase family protein [Ciceribacter sp. RN22]
MIEFKGLAGPSLTLDRSSVLDIGACIVDGVDLSPGRAIPDDGDPRIDHSLEGFLFTCGPDHIRHPEPVGEGRGTYPLHGSFSSHPTEILSFETVEGNAEARAVVSVRLADGGSARLERFWRIDGKTGEVHLSDRVTNTGAAPFPAMLMYHMNIGARHFDDGVRLSGAMLDGGGFPWAFGADPGGVFCVPAVKEGEPWAEVRLGPIQAIGGKTLRVRFRTDTLPFLQIWRNQQAPANVLGIEPVSHRWEPRSALAERGELDLLAPGEARDYALSFAFV